MRVVLFADIHIGSIKKIDYVRSIWDNIIGTEIRHQKTDLVVILGDYFDRLFKVNDEYVALAIGCMSDLVRACGNRTKIRIVYGTESHEMGQYVLFNHLLTSKHIDMRVIYHSEEEVIDGKRILYLPEEYVDDKHKAYADTLYSKHYDYIFGHGIIVDGMPEAVRYIKPVSKEKGVPRFKSGELSAASTLTVFGHYHVHVDLDNVHYLGSLFRWKFGEESPKGYGVIEDDRFTFVENPYAFTYKTYEFGLNEDEGEVMDKINRIKSEHSDMFSNTDGKIRFVFHSENPSFYEKVRTSMLNESQIVAKVESPPVQEPEDIEAGYEFIIDMSLGITDKIQRFIMKKYNRQMDYDLLDSYLHNELAL